MTLEKHEASENVLIFRKLNQHLNAKLKIALIRSPSSSYLNQVLIVNWQFRELHKLANCFCTHKGELCIMQNYISRFSKLI